MPTPSMDLFQAALSYGDACARLAQPGLSTREHKRAQRSVHDTLEILKAAAVTSRNTVRLQCGAS